MSDIKKIQNSIKARYEHLLDALLDLRDETRYSEDDDKSHFGFEIDRFINRLEEQIDEIVYKEFKE